MESTRRSHRLRLAAGLAAALLSAAPAAAQEGTIVVSGSGTVTLAPDAATVLVAIESKADSANAAGRANADVVAAVRARLGELGLGDDDVTTSRYNVRQDWRRDDGDRVPDGYVAETGLDVSVNDLADTGRVIDTALAAGANRIDGVQFRSSRMDAARHEALALAVQDAQRAAGAMAAAAGGVLGDLVELSTEGVARPVMERAYAADAAVMALGAVTSLSPGELTVSARVTGRWRFDRE